MIPNTDLFHKALRLSAWAHYGQVTKFGDPFITHPVAASYEVLGAALAGEKFDVDLATICVILHDVAEKSDIDIESIRKDFGKSVALGVDAMTKREVVAQEKQLEDSLLRILEQPKEIAIAKLADRVSGMIHPPKEWPKQKIETILSNAQIIYNMLSEASPFLASRLKKKIKIYKNELNIV